LWLNQGLAAFLDTIHRSEDGKSVVMGAFNPSALRKYKAYRSITVANVLAWTNSTPFQIDGERRGIEGLSWLLVHWLFNTRAEPFAHYQQDLSRGVPAAQAFAAAFPGFDPAAADKEIFEYSKHGSFTEMAAPLVETAYEVTARDLTPADQHVMAAHVARMRIANSKPGDDPTFKSEIESALALEPTNADAVVEQTWLPAAQRVPAVRAATAAHPRDERLWKLLGDLLRGPFGKVPEREEAYRKAIALAPKDPSTLTQLAWLLIDGKSAEALGLAKRAVQLAPADPDVLHTFAAASFLNGGCQDAIASEQKAMALLPPTTNKASFTATLTDYTTHCTKAPPKKGKR
jgi:tetratricopeptide (TPR) repeat protein